MPNIYPQNLFYPCHPRSILVKEFYTYSFLILQSCGYKLFALVPIFLTNPNG